MRKLYPIIILVALVSCKKSNADNEAPQLKIISPATRQHFATPEDVNLIVSVSDNVQVQSVNIRIQDSALVVIAPTISTRTYDIPVNKKDSQFGVLFNVGIDFKTAWKFTLTASDTNGNTSFQEITVNLN
jgi:hypothetical protein